jgi:N-hydroxyarylamine O-acetyltransferase
MGGMLDVLTRDRLLRRIGLDSVPPADAAGLAVAHRAYVSHVPFEDLSVQLGESARLEPSSLVERVLSDGRGGYCFEVNTVLLELLETLGFSVERRLAIVGARSGWTEGSPPNHMALVATTPAGEEFVVEGGWGEGPLDPVPLREGPVPMGPNVAALERDGDGWWFAQHEFGTTPGFRFADAPATLDDFQEHHARLSRSDESMFVQTLVVQQPYDDRIVTLRARTTFVDGRHVRERGVVDSEARFAAVLREQFGITMEGERLARLWARAVEQHEAHSADG